MSGVLLLFLISIGAVAFFVLGLSLTLIFKGRPIDSEIGDNRHMQKRGIRCTASQFHEEEALLRGKEAGDGLYTCASCNPSCDRTDCHS